MLLMGVGGKLVAQRRLGTIRFKSMLIESDMPPTNDFTGWKSSGHFLRALSNFDCRCLSLAVSDDLQRDFIMHVGCGEERYQVSVAVHGLSIEGSNYVAWLETCALSWRVFIHRINRGIFHRFEVHSHPSMRTHVRVR